MQSPAIRSARRLLCLLSVMVCGPWAVPAAAQVNLNRMADRVGIAIVSEGRSGGGLRDTRVRQLPWQKISAEGQQRIRSVLDDCAQFRQLPQLEFEVTPELYRYLVQHPDVAVSTWRVMGISGVRMWQTGPREYEAEAPDGSMGRADILYQDDSQCLLLCDGTYSNPLLPRPITASGLVWLRYSFRPDQSGAMQVRQKLDVFVSFPSAAARTMAAFVSPITNVMMDRNAFEVSLYARMMSQAVRTDPGWVEQIARRMDGVLPDRRSEMVSLVRSVETGRDRTTMVSGRTDRRAAPLQAFQTSLRDVRQSAVFAPPTQTAPATPGVAGQSTFLYFPASSTAAVDSAQAAPATR